MSDYAIVINVFAAMSLLLLFSSAGLLAATGARRRSRSASDN